MALAAAGADVSEPSPGQFPVPGDRASRVIAPPTTSASAATYTYDVQSIALVEVCATDGAVAGRKQPGDLSERSALPSAEPEGASTTPWLSLNATNTADDVLRLSTEDSWGNLNTLDDHFARHGADFGASSADDYALQASEFLQKPGTLTKVDPKTGVIRVYEPSTNTFGAYNSSGTTRTFYQPDPAVHGYPTNLDYWKAQPG
jgi:hypothetical protein